MKKAITTSKLNNLTALFWNGRFLLNKNNSLTLSNVKNRKRKLPGNY